MRESHFLLFSSKLAWASRYEACITVSMELLRSWASLRSCWLNSAGILPPTTTASVGFFSSFSAGRAEDFILVCGGMAPGPRGFFIVDRCTTFDRCDLGPKTRRFHND